MRFNLENQSLERKLDIALKAINFFQPPHKQLTDLEIILVTLIGQMPDKFKYAPFSVPAKKFIRAQAMEKYNWNITPINFNNKLYSLRDKGLIYHDEDGVMYMTPIFAQLLKEIKDSVNDNTNWELSFFFPKKKTDASEETLPRREDKDSGEQENISTEEERGGDTEGQEG